MIVCAPYVNIRGDIKTFIYKSKILFKKSLGHYLLDYDRGLYMSMQGCFDCSKLWEETFATFHSVGPGMIQLRDQSTTDTLKR